MIPARVLHWLEIGLGQIHLRVGAHVGLEEDDEVGEDGAKFGKQGRPVHREEAKCCEWCLVLNLEELSKLFNCHKNLRGIILIILVNY